jgi:phosphoribosyl 1,2-cyclic phosphate phosphodiesterase
LFGLRILPFNLPHGHTVTLGFVFVLGGTPRFAYFSDCKDVPPEAIAAANGVKALALDAVRRLPHPTHMNVERAIEVAKCINPERAFITHLCHDLSHAETELELPPPIGIAYDGLQLDL